MPRSRLVASVVACALPWLLAACGGTPADDPRTKAPVVRTAIVEDGRSTSRSFTGVVSARVESNLGFRVAGAVTERLVEVGQSVRRGQPLMRIDATDLKLSADAQSEAVHAARARAKAADQRTDHYQDLRNQGAVSDDEYDEAKAAERAAKAELDAAQDQADIAHNTSRYSVLVADSDGVVVETAAEPGEVVTAGQPVIQLAKAGPREAVIQLPETLRPKVGSTGQATLFGHKGSGQATLRQLSSAADPVTRTFDAHYVLEGDLDDAPLGSTVTIELPNDETDESSTRLRVPIGAVVDDGQGPGVWAVEGDPPTTSWRSVSVQRVDDDYAYVTGDISRGDRVVALGAHLIREGQHVRTETAAAESASR
jgi:RND family efflux transporter MFP subunit